MYRSAGGRGVAVLVLTRIVRTVRTIERAGATGREGRANSDGPSRRRNRSDRPSAGLRQKTRARFPLVGGRFAVPLTNTAGFGLHCPEKAN